MYWVDLTYPNIFYMDYTWIIHGLYMDYTSSTQLNISQAISSDRVFAWEAAANHTDTNATPGSRGVQQDIRHRKTNLVGGWATTLKKYMSQLG